MLVSEAMAAMGPPPEGDAKAGETMAEDAKKDGEAADAMTAPDVLPVTGGDANPSKTFLVLGMVILFGGLFAFATRRRIA